MSRFVLRYRGAGPKPLDVLPRIREVVPVANIIDESSRMILLEAPESSEVLLRDKMPDWIVSPQRAYSLPRPPIPNIRTS